MEYISVQQAAEKWGVTQRCVQRYLKNERIDGAIRFSRVWMIPKDAQQPEDGRKNNRRQPKKSEVKPDGTDKQ
jgi:hypothetical protein